MLGTDFTTPSELTQPANPTDTTADTTTDTSSSPGSGGPPAASLHTDGIPCVK